VIYHTSLNIVFHFRNLGQSNLYWFSGQISSSLRNLRFGVTGENPLISRGFMG
jgi:hypothetical protein